MPYDSGKVVCWRKNADGDLVGGYCPMCGSDRYLLPHLRVPIELRKAQECITVVLEAVDSC